MFKVVLTFVAITALCLQGASQTSAPQQFETNANGGEIELTWSQVTGATGYQIFRDGNLIKNISDGTNTAYTDRGPIAGSVHKYCIKSVGAGGAISPYTNCLYDSSATNAFIASDSSSDGYIDLSWSVPVNCMQAAGEEDIYLEVWDSTADEEFYNAMLDTTQLPTGFDLIEYMPLAGGEFLDLIPGAPNVAVQDLIKRLGVSIAVDGNYAVVGAINDNGGIGGAMIFEYSGGSWDLQEELAPSDGKVGDKFGYDVAIDGDYVAVTSFSDTGKAYVYHNTGGSWVEEDVLMANYPATDDDFGRSVAIKGDQVYVGAPTKYFNLGVVFAFRKNGSTWPQYNMIAASTLQFGQMFGYDIAVDGNYFLSGAPGHNSGAGRLYVMQGSGSGWTHHQNMAPATIAAGDSFGSDVILKGSRAAVNATAHSGGIGSITTYELSGSNWSEDATLSVPAGVTAAFEYGSSMDLLNDQLIVGAPGGNGNLGTAYLYERSGGTWSMDHQFTEPVASGDEYGMGVALSANHVLIGCPGEDNDRGSLYIYDKGGSFSQLQKEQVGGVDPQTLESWVYVENRTHKNVLFADDGTALVLNDEPNDPRVGIIIDGLPTVYFDYVIPDHHWTHLAVVVDPASGHTKLYVNGKLMDEMEELFPVGYRKMGYYDGNYSNMRVDNMRIWNVARSASQIENNFDAELTGSETGLEEAFRLEFPGSFNRFIYQVKGGHLMETADYNPPNISNKAVQEQIPETFKGNIKHWLGPSEERRYSFNLHIDGPGTRLCNQLYDKGSTLPFQPPSLTSTSNLPDTIQLDFTNYSHAASYFRVFRDTTFLGTVDSGDHIYKDAFRFGQATSLANGVPYNYCLEPVSARFGESYPPVCTNGTTYDINLQASDNAYPSQVELMWANLAPFANELVILRDGNELATLGSNLTTYVDSFPVPGTEHRYTLRMMEDEEVNATNSDTGSVNSIGVLAGNVLTSEGKFIDKGIVIEATAIVQGDTMTYRDTTGFAGQFRMEEVYFGNAATYTIQAFADGLLFDNIPLSVTLNLSTPEKDDIFIFDQNVENEQPQAFLSAFDAQPDSGQDQMHLTWDYGQVDTTWFVLFRNNQVIKVLSDTNLTKVTEYHDADITPGDTFDYRIKAYYKGNDTTYFSHQLSTEGAADELTPVAALNATADTMQGVVNLDWTHTSTNIDGFYLYRDAQLIDSVPLDEPKVLVDKYGVPGQTYTYGIRAFLRKPDSTYTSDRTDTTPVVYPALPKPYNVTAASDTDKVHVMWNYAKTANVNFDGFILVREAGAVSDTLDFIYFTSYSSEDATEYTYKFTDYTGAPGIDYTYKVMSMKRMPGYLTAPESVAHMFPDVFSPVNFTVSQGSTSGSIDMSWEHASDNHDGFVLVGPGDTLALMPAYDREYVDAVLTSATPVVRNYKLHAYRTVEGFTFLSNPAETGSATPSANADDGLQEPKDFVASDIYPNQVQLKWRYPTFIYAKFRIYKDGVLIDSLGKEARFYYDTDVQPGDRPVYQVEAVYNGDVSAKATDAGSLKGVAIIEGKAFASNDLGIPGVRVEVYDVGGKLMGKAFTDSSGFYSIQGLPSDSGKVYNVKASRINTDFTESTKQATIGDDLVYTVDFFDTNWEPYTNPAKESMAEIIYAYAVADSFNQAVKIRWMVNSDNYDGFDVFKGFTPLQSLEKGDTLEIIDYNVEPNYTYSYLIRAYRNTPEGFEYSEMVPVEAFVPPFAPVEGYELVINKFRDEIQLYWSHPTNAVTHYMINRNGETIDLVEPDQELSLIDSTGLPNRLYNYSIKAVKQTANGLIESPTETRSATFPNVAVVTNLEAIPEADSNYVTLTWEHTSPHYSYACIYRNGIRIDTLTKDDNKIYKDDRGHPDSLTEWAVSAVTVKDDVRYESDTVTVEEVFPTLNEPVVAGVSELDNALEINLNYPATYGYGGYFIYRDNSLLTVVRDSSGSYTFVDDNGEAEKPYTYRINAVKKFGLDYDTSAPVFLNEIFPDLAAPNNLSASDGQYYNYVEVTWTYPDDNADGFIVYRKSPEAGATFDSVGIVGGKQRTYVDQFTIDNNVTSPPFYIYKVRAYQDNSLGRMYSAESNEDDGYARINRLKTTGVLADTAGGNNKYGSSISTDGNRVAMGGNDGNEGKVLVFEKDQFGNFQSDTESGAIQTHTNFNNDQEMGTSVVIQGDKLYAGAPGGDAIGTDNGLIYGFERGSTTWNLTETIYANNPDTVAGSAIWDDGLGLAFIAGFIPNQEFALVDLGLPTDNYTLGENIWIDQVVLNLKYDQNQVTCSGCDNESDHFRMYLETPSNNESVMLFNRQGIYDYEDTLTNVRIWPDANGYPELEEVGGDTTITGDYVAHGGDDIADFNSSGESANGNWRLRFEFSGETFDQLILDFESITINYRYLEPGSDGTGGRMGASMAYNKGKIAAGAPKINTTYPTGSNKDGGVILFSNTSGNFEKQSGSYLFDPRDAEYGTAVDIDDNTIIIGAPKRSNNRGGAYIYDINSNNQIDDETKDNLLPSVVPSGSEFGYAVGVAGDFAVVGAPEYKGEGAAYIFERNSNNEWEYAGELPYNDPQQDARYGASVDIDGQFIAIGAPGYNGGEGRVTLLERQNDGNWGFSREYVSPDGSAGSEEFGTSISIGGNILAVGAPEKQSQTTQTYWFYWNGNYYPINYTESNNTGGGYIFYLDASPKDVVATDGEFENKTRITWNYNGLSENVDKFKVYRDTVYIGDVDANKNIFFDETGVPGTRYVYNVSAIFKAGSESIKVGDIGYSKNNGVIDGSVVTQNGSVGVKGVAVVARGTVDGIDYTYHDTTDLNGRYKMNRVYYSDSSVYNVKVFKEGHEFVKDTQFTQLTISQPEAMVDPFLDKTAFVATGKVVKYDTDCGIDSLNVTVEIVHTDSSIQARMETTNEDGEFSYVINPYDPNIAYYRFKPDSQQVITVNQTTDTLMYDIKPRSRKVMQMADPDNVPMVQSVAPFEDQVKYPLQIRINNVCENFAPQDWKVQITSSNGCFSKIVSSQNANTLLDTLPPYKFTIRVIGISNPTPDLVPVIDYLKVRPQQLDLASFYQEHKLDKRDTLFTIPFIFHKTPQISLEGIAQDSFLCGDPSQAWVTTQGLMKQVSFRVTEQFDNDICDVNEGFLIIRNEAGTNPVDTLKYDPQLGEFPEYEFEVGAPNLVEPYTKPLIAEYHTAKDGFLAEFIQPVLIKGLAMLPGADIYVQPSDDPDNPSDILMPIFDLYDPPGDGSSSYIEKGTTIEKDIRLYFNNDFAVFAGLEQETDIGGIEVSLDFTQRFNAGYGFARGYTLTATTTERLETSDASGGDNTQNDSAFVGNMEDVIVGLGIALKYGTGYQIYLDGCEPKQKQVIATQGDINTKWVYTVDQIRSLMEEFTKKKEMALEGSLTLPGRSPSEAADFYETMRKNWKEILRYHFYTNVPYVSMCNYSFRDLPEPWQEIAGEYLRDNFCTEIGRYSGGKFLPNDNIEWNSDLLDKYNIARGYVEETYNNYIEYARLDSFGLTEFIPDDIGELYLPEAKNITFSGGASYSEDYSTGVSHYTTVDQFFASQTTFELSAGVDVEARVVTLAGAIAAYAGTTYDLGEAKALVKGGLEVNIDFGRNDFKSTTNDFATGYTLTDDDPGDQFSVTIFKGVNKNTTPYFDLFGGRSSCPAEPGTIYRDQPQLDTRYPSGQAVNKTKFDQDPDKPVLYPLQLASINPFNESRWYQLYLVENTNPYGATLKVNGSVLSTNGNQDFFLAPNEPIYATLTIDRNPFYYEYEGLQIGMRSLCDPYVNDIITLNVNYRHPCTNVSIIEPGNDWVINSDTAQMLIKMSDYNPYNDQLNRLQLVYRRLGQNEWDTLESLSPNYLKQYYETYKTVYKVPTFPFVWNINDFDVPDGQYEIMAIANCGTGGFIYSNRIQGTVDRNSLQVFGKPEPSDGVLSMGDEISVTFNKSLDCPYSMSDGVWSFHLDSLGGPTVSVSAMCSGSKMLFELDSVGQLEGRMIYARLDSVQDRNYNLQSEEVTWSFRVSNNPIFWAPMSAEISVVRGMEKSMEVMLESQSSVNRGYALTNDKLWLTYSQPVGVVQPTGQPMTLNFNAENLSLGTYTDTIFADIAGFTTIALPVKMHVIAPPPDWNVDEADYTESVSVIAELKVGTEVDTNFNNKISAWVEGELRGVGNIQAAGDGYHAAYINVSGSDADDGKPIHFRVWLADSGKVYKGHPEYPIDYQSGGIVYGTTPDPLDVTVNPDSGDEMYYIPLNKGWTWFSINREMEDMSVNTALSSISPHSDDVIMMLDTNNSAEYQESVGIWISNGLDSLTTMDGYMIHLKEADTLWLYGAPADKDNHNLFAGWNFIGNQNREPVAINDAFENFSQFADSNIIKSQTQFAEYVDDEWSGNLTTLYPNEAYKVWVNSFSTIAFRGGNAEWEVNPYAFEYGQRAVGVIQIDGYELTDDDSKVGAFVDGECRGVGELKYVPEMDRHLLVMMIYGHRSGEEVSFRIYDGVTDSILHCKQTISLSTTKLLGSYRRPHVFSPNATTGIQNLGADGMNPDFEISPNPFTTELQLNFKDGQANKYVVEIYNGVGEVFFQRQLTSAKGANQWTIKPGKRLASGMYYVTIKQDGNILRTFKVVKE